jgi:diguanylate cyclase (GGDEF)-like protein/PAS domain S-box-containing protein
VKTTTTRLHQNTFSAIFKWRSLKTRLTLFTLAIFVIGVWLLAFYTSRMLREDMQLMLGKHQFSSVSLVAAHVNAEMDGRLRALEKVAARITPAIMGNALSLQTFLEDRPALVSMFSGGVYVTRLDGTGIADVPISTGRIGVNYSDRDYIVEALKGKSAISRPVIGKKLNAPVVVIASPIRDTEGKVIGALMGGINLGIPNFLDKIVESRYGKTGDYFLVSPQYRLNITSSDKTRIMEALPAPGIHRGMDRFLQGYEGSALYVNPRGVEMLVSYKLIPVAGWAMVATLPAAEAFEPIHTMRLRMLLAAIFLTMLAGGLTWWMLNRQLSPMLVAAKTLATLSAAGEPPQPLPINREDEIGKLIGAFNHLLETLGKREEELKTSEEKFSKAFQTSPYAITITRASDGKFIDVNDAFTAITGFTREEALADSSIALKLWVDEGDRIRVVSALREDRTVTGQEFPFRKKNGAVITGLFSAQVFQLENETCILSSINDINERKLVEKALQDSEKRYRELSIVDDLTQLYNSRYFYHQLKMEIDRVNRYDEQPLTLLLLDLDDFKHFNDAYGHVEGDQVLSRLGQVVKRCLRQTDSAYRYGGEEFTILLPMTTSEDAAVTAKRISAEFKKENFSPAPGQEVHLTMSIGLAQYERQEDMKAFVNRVDQLMYQAKKNGKDRFCSES